MDIFYFLPTPLNYPGSPSHSLLAPPSPLLPPNRECAFSAASGRWPAVLMRRSSCHVRAGMIFYWTFSVIVILVRRCTHPYPPLWPPCCPRAACCAASRPHPTDHTDATSPNHHPIIRSWSTS